MEIPEIDSPQLAPVPPMQDPLASPPRGSPWTPDTLSRPPAKPSLIYRGVVHLGLVFFQMATWAIQASNWVLKNFFGLASRQKVLYRELFGICQTKNFEKIEAFLKHHSKKTHAAGFLFSEFLALPEIYFFLPEILKGANVRIYKDEGFFCRRWSQHSLARQRVSSHRYQGRECYEVGHFLFWLDPEGHTRFQFERSPFRGVFGFVNHGIDFLRYLRDCEQQGVVGNSPFTEEHCLTVPIDPADYLDRREESVI